MYAISSLQRYCNLFPFDENIVSLENPDHYINASWMKILPWLPDRKFIVTMVSKLSITHAI